MGTTQAPLSGVHPNFVTTAFELPGYRVVRNLGVVRGIVVRSRSFSAPSAPPSDAVRRQHHPVTEMCEKARREAFD